VSWNGVEGRIEWELQPAQIQANIRKRADGRWLRHREYWDGGICFPRFFNGLRFIDGTVGF